MHLENDVFINMSRTMNILNETIRRVLACKLMQKLVSYYILLVARVLTLKDNVSMACGSLCSINMVISKPTAAKPATIVKGSRKAASKHSTLVMQAQNTIAKKAIEHAIHTITMKTRGICVDTR